MSTYRAGEISGPTSPDVTGLVIALSGSGAQVNVRGGTVFAVLPLHITDVQAGDTIRMTPVGTGTWMVSAVYPRATPTAG